MGSILVVKLPSRVVERLVVEAQRLGLTLEEYLLELASRDLDPKDRAKEYIEVSKELLEQAREELAKGDVRQAAEKLWGAASLALKAYAYWREGKRLASHGELWEYSKKVMEEMGDWVYDAWMAANGMHVCFYEGWCTDKHVEEAIKRIERFVKEVERVVKA